MTTLHVHHKTPPHALSFLLRALRPSRGWSTISGFPDLRMSWERPLADTRQRNKIAAMVGIPAQSAAMKLFQPHIIGFRLVMATLTHPAWPLPIWGALQVRNRIHLHDHFDYGESDLMTTQVAAWRVQEKGIEVDLQSRYMRGDRCLWENIITFFYRGNFGACAVMGISPGAPSSPPEVIMQRIPRMKVLAQWQTTVAARWAFGSMTGDYNGIHQWDWYARQFGFPAAFSHSQRIALQCLARIPAGEILQGQLDLWLRGPVFYGSEVILRLDPQGENRSFSLHISDQNRPALIGHWQPG